MPRRGPEQPLRRGFTVAEMLVGIAVSAIVSSVLIGLLRAGLVSYRVAARTQLVLMNARRALQGDGAGAGLLADMRAARAAALNPTSFSLTLPLAVDPVEYDVVDGALWRTQGGDGIIQADGTTDMRPSYYRMNAAGRIEAATGASDATMATVLLTVEGPDRKPQLFFTGARLRNFEP